jgi:uncharacterized protein with HEPN domain
MKDKNLESRGRIMHIREAIGKIELFVRDVGKDDFMNNQLVSSAVLFQFSVIGEAIAHIEEDILRKFQYPWHKVRSFRNLISHAYFHIKLDAVWHLIESDLPGLKQVIETILEQEF